MAPRTRKQRYLGQNATQARSKYRQERLTSHRQPPLEDPFVAEQPPSTSTEYVSTIKAHIYRTSITSPQRSLVARAAIYALRPSPARSRAPRSTAPRTVDVMIHPPPRYEAERSVQQSIPRAYHRADTAAACTAAYPIPHSIASSAAAAPEARKPSHPYDTAFASRHTHPYTPDPALAAALPFPPATRAAASHLSPPPCTYTALAARRCPCAKLAPPSAAALRYPRADGAYPPVIPRYDAASAHA